jgi:hypothetical protein
VRIGDIDIELNAARSYDPEALEKKLRHDRRFFQAR